MLYVICDNFYEPDSLILPLKVTGCVATGLCNYPLYNDEVL